VTIAVGDRIPDVKVFTFSDKGPDATTSTEVLGRGKVVLFGVPGAFTPTCSDHHLPGFVLRADELRAKGAEKVVCVSVNDPFVMGAWGQDQKVGSSVVMLADGNGELADAMGLTMDGTGFGLGKRSQRFAPSLRRRRLTRDYPRGAHPAAVAAARRDCGRPAGDGSHRVRHHRRRYTRWRHDRVEPQSDRARHRYVRQSTRHRGACIAATNGGPRRRPHAAAAGWRVSGAMIRLLRRRF